jgi:hypothetical protein
VLFRSKAKKGIVHIVRRIGDCDAIDKGLGHVSRPL